METQRGCPRTKHGLHKGLGIALSTVIHHPKELRKSGLISTEWRRRRMERTVNLDIVLETGRLLEIGQLDLSMIN